MKRNILWYQPEILKDEDVIIFNGTRFNMGEDYVNYFQEIKKVSDLAIGHKNPWGGRIKDVYFAKGLLSAKDEKGRNLGFMFISNEKRGLDALIRELDIIGYKMTPDTEKKLKHDQKIVKCGFIALSIIIVIFLFLLIYSKYGN